MSRGEGWYVSTNEEELGEGPFTTKEEALVHAREEMLEELGLEDEGFIAHLTEAKTAKLAYTPDANDILIRLSENLAPDLCAEEDWPMLETKHGEAMEDEVAAVIEKHLRAAGQWPRLEVGKYEQVEIPAVKWKEAEKFPPLKDALED